MGPGPGAEQKDWERGTRGALKQEVEIWDVGERQRILEGGKKRVGGRG